MSFPKIVGVMTESDDDGESPFDPTSRRLTTSNPPLYQEEKVVRKKSSGSEFEIKTHHSHSSLPSSHPPPLLLSSSELTFSGDKTSQKIIDMTTITSSFSSKLSFLVKAADGCGHVLNDLCASLWFSYLLLYLQNVVKLGSDYAAGLLLLGQVVDAVATPLIGYAADSSFNCCLCKKNYGQCKSWHLFGVILVLASFPFVFSPCIGCAGSEDWVKFFYYAPFIAVFQIGWASTQVSHLALLPKMSPNELVRTELLAIRYGYTVGSNVTIFIIAWLTFGFTENCIIDSDDDSKFRNLALMAVCIGSLFVIFFHLIVKEDTAAEQEFKVREEMAKQLEKKSQINLLNIDTQNLAHDLKDNFLKNFRPAKIFSTKSLSLGKPKMSMRDWLSLPQFYIVAGIYMATRLSVNVTQVYIPLYLQNYLRLPCKSVATVPLTMYIFGFLVALIIKFVNKYLGRQLSYTMGAVLSLLGSFFIVCLDWESSEFLRDYGIYGVAALLGGGASSILVTSLSITADMIGNNVENGAFIYGAMSFTDKLSCGLAVMLINTLLPSDVTGGELYSVNFYRDVVGYTCGGCALVGVIGVLGLTYRIYYQEKEDRKRETVQVKI